THLLPEAGNVDSLAEDAFETAQRLDPRGANLLLHLIEIRLKRGDFAEGEPMGRGVLAANPGSSPLGANGRMMEACVRDGPTRVDWRAEAQKNSLAVLAAGTMFAAGGGRLDCAMPALAGVIRADTTKIGDDRWFALLQLQALLLAQGRTAEAI